MPSITWQKLMDVLTLKGRDIHGLQQVKEAKDDKARFKICYNHNKSFLLEWMNECLNESKDQKSASQSALHRTKGNSFYKLGNYDKSFELYNKSVIIAPYGTEEMALALANRSAVLSRLQHFEEALNDIELALESGYPEDKKHKLYLRKAKLLIDYKKSNEAIEVLNEMEKLCIGNSDVKIQEDVATTYLTATYMANNELEAMEPISCDLPKLAKGENSDFKSASKKIDLKNSTEKGRYIVANTKVNKGDVLFVEKPFALIILPDQTYKHCHHCCKIFNAPIPCSECNEALYCSNQCRLDSWLFYHKWECGGLPLCYNIGIAHLGLRVALQSQTTLETAQYQQVYNLLPHTENMTSEDLYQYSLTAALLTIYLDQRKNYFLVQHDETDMEAMGGRILRHIAQLICNGHAITKVDFCDDKIKSDKIIGESNQRIATAIYPSASMMNHSCNNNISNSFVNEFLIVRASKDIKKGDEVFNCYGPHYKQMEVEERQQILKSQYFFTCKCDKCVSPESDFLKPYSALRCISCEGPIFKDTFNCTSCNKRQPAVELMNMSLNACSIAAQGRELSTKGEFEGAIKCFEKCLELGQKCLFKDNFDLIHYKDQLAKNYAALGDYNKSASYLEECLPLIEERYGGDSIELSQEYMKLKDIRFLQLGNLSNDPTTMEYRRVYKKTKELLKRIQTIIEINSSKISPADMKIFDDFKLPVDFSS